MVSVVIPTFNRASFLLNTSIPSVRAQTVSDWELLIVDDGSIDNTKEISERFCKDDSRIRYFYKENGGQGSARNFGIEKSRGNLILFLDSDDILLPNFLEIICAVQKSGNFDTVSSQRWIVSYENLTILGVEGPSPSSTLYKKKLFNKLGYFNEARELIGFEDIDLFIRWEKETSKENFKEYIIGKPLVIYGDHSEQVTKENLKKKVKSLEFLLMKHLNSQEKVEGVVYKKVLQLAYYKFVLGEIVASRKILFFLFKQSIYVAPSMMFFVTLFKNSIFISFFKVIREISRTFVRKIYFIKTFLFYYALFIQAREKIKYLKETDK